MEDPEASQRVDCTSAEVVERHYRRGCRAPSGTGNRWSDFEGTEHRKEQREQRRIKWKTRQKGEGVGIMREIMDEGGQLGSRRVID